MIIWNLYLSQLETLNRYHYAKGGKLDNSFKSAKDYENYLRKGGKPFDSVVIDKEEFHQDYYDMSGKKISYSPYTYPINKRRTLDIETSNRYENGFGDAEVEIYAKGGKTEGDIDEAMFGMDKWLPDDEDAIREFQDIEDDGDVEDMIEYLNSYSDEDILSERYGVTNSDFPEMAKKIMKKSLAKGGTLSEKAVKKNYIRRDRYDKLKKEKDAKIDELKNENKDKVSDLKKDLKEKGADCYDDIKQTKKDIGKTVAKRIDQVEKKVAKEKDEQCDDLTERINDECEQDIYKGDDRREKEKTESLMLGGLGGLLLGFFLSR